ncbi:unnamed protein product [Clavelina lepadiformis]|uniref:C-type lectin domain-containing protein n=1 Tax=Clavelina lepadiformis TaxID=159417 RepID=A0ABP0FQG5_CLALP
MHVKGLSESDRSLTALNLTSGHNSIDLRSWGDADKECQNRMGYLASIHSDIENKAFVSWTDQKNVWIGLQRNGWGGWDWVDKTPLDFTKWAEGEPSDSGETGEACVELYTNGGWNDAFCSTTKGFICKKHKTYSTCAYPIDQRDDCGYDGISEYECISRGCCWDEAGSGPHPCFYSKADSACIEKGGTCKDYRYVSCELGYETNLCSGGAENQCCFSCASDDDVCNDQADEWEMGDEQCEAGGYGTCQDDSNYCASGSYESGKCGGPTNRRCCVGWCNTWL